MGRDDPESKVRTERHGDTATLRERLMNSDEFIERSNRFARVDRANQRASDVTAYVHWLLEELRHHQRATDIARALSVRVGGGVTGSSDLFGEVQLGAIEINELRQAIDVVLAHTVHLKTLLETLRATLQRRDGQMSAVDQKGLKEVEQGLPFCIEQLSLAATVFSKRIDALRHGLKESFDRLG